MHTQMFIALESSGLHHDVYQLGLDNWKKVFIYPWWAPCRRKRQESIIGGYTKEG